MKRLTVALLVFGLFTPTVFAQTAEQEEVILPSCVEIIRGTQRQCENVISATAGETNEKTARKGGKAHSKRLMPEHGRARATKVSKAAAKAEPLYLLETIQTIQIRDFEDGPEGPLISVAR